MDILIRLRMVLWVLVLSLWGLMVYQFLGDDSAPEQGQMKWVSRRVENVHRRELDVEDDLPDIEADGTIPADKLFEQKPPSDLTSQPAATVKGSETGAKLARIPASVGAMTPIKPPPGYTGPVPLGRKEQPRPPPEARPIPTRPVRPAQPPEEDATPPKGFTRTQTKHFNVFAEGRPPSLEFLETLENLHANLMLDLAAFSPWAREERASIFLFRDQESYRRVTGRPAWSGGASSVKRRKIYLYESEELVGILAHELTHIYFDSFFLGGVTDPLWLSEGMATLVQTERGLAAPNWLKQNLDVIKRGGGYALDELIRVENTSGAADEEIRLWYSQSYSVVRFLIRSQYKSSFYKFCRFIRDGSTVKESLYRAYGMPFTTVKALEYAWRYDAQSGPRRAQQ
ncbi:MAG: hypothetical protein HYZ75_10190 [Elusimicrobia bacterium]|nr:hypothetical protein [Elusimicrobiota bacterium]